jgi:hypothetical protein
MDFNQLVGKQVDFYGTDNNVFCIGQDKRTAFEAVEDESDGYRSMMEELRHVPSKGHIFFRQPIARVRVELDTELDGYRLVDKSGHVWLRVGTDRADGYYPVFTFDYQPKR